MGIQDLTKTIKKHAPDAIIKLKPEDLPGKVYGVDAFSYLYPAKYNPGAKGRGQHLRFFIELAASWMSAGKTLVLVFDGDTSKIEAKKETIEKRKETQAAAEAAGHETIKVTEEDVSALKRLLGQLNITYYQASGEADTLLAALFEAGKIDGVISEDSDLMTHGIKYLVRGLIDAGNRSAGVVNLYDLDQVYLGLKLNKQQFIDFCILSGCDYCDRIPGVGPVSALKHIRSGGTPLTIQGAPAGYEARYLVALEQFTNHDFIGEPTSSGSLEPDKEWILQETNYSPKTLDEKLEVISRGSGAPKEKLKPIIKRK